MTATRRIRPLVVLVAVALAAGGLSAAEEKEEGFVSLFNGKDLTGWEGATKGYVARDGVIVCKKDGGGNLWTKDEFSDFHLKFEFRLTPGANNGLGIRMAPNAHAAFQAMELQILDDTAEKYAKLKPYQYHGSVYGVVPAKRGHLKPVGEWNQQEVIARQGRIRVILNGTTIVDADVWAIDPEKTLDGRPHPGLHNKKGRIGFLGHGAHVEFRNLRIKDLAADAAPAATAAEKHPWVTYEGGDGPGKGKHLVFLAGDDEYRSEELMPQLARIAAKRHGFKCTVVWAINPKTGEIDPSVKDHMPGVHLLDEADLMVMFLRFRALPPEQMKHLMDYTNSGRPMMGLRTSTHAFNYGGKSDNPYAKYSFRSKDPKGGYGRMVFGETWISHYGAHKRESTLGIIPPEAKDHPIVRGIEKVWGPSDVYGLTELEGDCKTIVLGQPLAGMEPDSPPNEKKKAIPVAWTKHFTGTSGRQARVFTTTMGHAHDLKDEGFRRLCVNALYWCVGREEKIPAESNVDLVGQYDPKPIGMRGHRKGMMPDDFRME